MAVASTGFSTGNVASLFGARSERAASAFERPVERLARETESARVRLSDFGRVQSATAAVQSSSRGLQDARQVSTAVDARKAAEAFVQAFNSERSALARVVAGGEAGGAASAESGRARIATGQLERLVSDNASAFRDAGIRVQQDGSLAVDAKALEAAYAADPTAVTRSLGSIGRAAEATVTRQLSGAGSVGAAVNNLSNRVQQLENRENVARTRIEESQRAVEASVRRYGFGAVGAGAYLGIFGL